MCAFGLHIKAPVYYGRKIMMTKSVFVLFSEISNEPRSQSTNTDKACKRFHQHRKVLCTLPLYEPPLDDWWEIFIDTSFINFQLKWKKHATFTENSNFRAVFYPMCLSHWHSFRLNLVGWIGEISIFKIIPNDCISCSSLACSLAICLVLPQITDFDASPSETTLHTHLFFHFYQPPPWRINVPASMHRFRLCIRSLALIPFKLTPHNYTVANVHYVSNFIFNFGIWSNHSELSLSLPLLLPLYVHLPSGPRHFCSVHPLPAVSIVHLSRTRMHTHTQTMMERMAVVVAIYARIHIISRLLVVLSFSLLFRFSNFPIPFALCISHTMNSYMPREKATGRRNERESRECFLPPSLVCFFFFTIRSRVLCRFSF